MQRPPHVCSKPSASWPSRPRPFRRLHQSTFQSQASLGSSQSCRLVRLSLAREKLCLLRRPLGGLRPSRSLHIRRASRRSRPGSASTKLWWTTSGAVSPPARSPLIPLIRRSTRSWSSPDAPPLENVSSAQRALSPSDKPPSGMQCPEGTLVGLDRTGGPLASRVALF